MSQSNPILSRLPRMSLWVVLAAALLLLIALVAPQQLAVDLHKASLLCLAGVIGYWLDRGLFPYSRPDNYLQTDNWRELLCGLGKSATDADIKVAAGYHWLFALAMLRRAVIVGAAMLALALGL
ncbi:putative holin [Parachitinimonas caeni]|uniref:Holin n=1 Tax=Parachitinimonas caeni TaxID=3031301 RepID=A0ABT7DWM1_9NEIS|nr:putative holin [Parachitinimonas caeni]MDK2124471.1 putative holin [Parachitinimonas caeni]